METQDSIPDGTPLHLLRGLLVLGASGKLIACGGIAQQTDLASSMVAGWHEARSRQRSLFTVEGPGGAGIIVVGLRVDDAAVLVAMPRDSRDPLFEFAGSVDFAGDILAHFLTNPFEALSVVDAQSFVRYMSPVHERFFGLQPGAAVGRHVTEVIENTRLHHVVETGKAEIGLLQEMRGVTRVVTRHPIRDSHGQLVGAIGQVMFKGPEQLQALSSELTKLKSEVAFYRRELSDLRNRSYGLDQMVGESLAMKRLKQQIVKVAPLDVPVLLTGESGTGKELVAHAIHKLSPRREATMVMVNAAALPVTLVESELFGYEAGSFTGAERKGRKGKVEQADGGSLFFDEVGDMPFEVQVKLLRVLQDGSFQRVGGSDMLFSKFRLISASNRNFEVMIADGAFRLDLFYRIAPITIRLPSLGERLEDIPLLTELALTQFAERHSLRRKRISDEAIEFLQNQRWPGNLRQLIHVVERAAIFSDADVIVPSDFGIINAPPPDSFQAPVQHPENGVVDTRDASPKPTGVRSAVGQVEAQLIRQSMERNHGNKKRVAAELGISRSYLYKRLAQIGIPVTEPQA